MSGTKINEATLRETLKGTENIPIVDTDLPKGRTTAAKLKEYVQPDLSGYALKTEIPDISGLATKAEVQEVKDALRNVWAGALSLRRVRKRGLFLAYTALIWLCYYLQFYLSFYCFGFSEGLGPVVGLVLFVVGSIAVVVPTPNGAGPWHFGVITMMMLYGVGQEDAGVFALLVHGVQTLLVVVLGIYGLMMLSFTNRRRKYGNNQDLGSAERVEAFL